MESTNSIINWNSPNILSEIACYIQHPLKSIIDANNMVSTQSDDTYSQQNAAAITLTNSRKIAKLVEEVLAIAKLNSVNILSKDEPVIFDIYDSNPNVRAMFQGELAPDKISSADKEWLKNLENIVFDEIKSCQINLFQLAYHVAVSERQLHRNIKSMLYLTPNTYIRILKLYKAHQLLESLSYRTIAEVAYAVGFLDTHYFTKVFYKQYGITPKECYNR